MELTPLNALSPLDGRYQSKLDPLRPCFSEYALIRHRMLVEVEWLKALAAEPAIAEIAAFSPQTIRELDDAIAKFGETEAAQVKAIRLLSQGRKPWRRPSSHSQPSAGSSTTWS